MIKLVGKLYLFLKMVPLILIGSTATTGILSAVFYLLDKPKTSRIFRILALVSLVLTTISPFIDIILACLIANNSNLP